MRFSRSGKSWAAAGRRLFGESEPAAENDTAVATEERNALLERPVSEEKTMATLEEESPLAGDPTQRLLTALGRFQRQVAKAEDGAPQHVWCDECMNQIITGIEIALNQGWSDVREALTDSARILQSYEDAGEASLCVPFLQDSYEILCLMVGDIIVDNVRSGVMHKWRERYQIAVEDLTAAGLLLIRDEPSHFDAGAARAAAPGHAAPQASPQDAGYDDYEEDDEEEVYDERTVETPAPVSAAPAQAESTFEAPGSLYDETAEDLPSEEERYDLAETGAGNPFDEATDSEPDFDAVLDAGIDGGAGQAAEEAPSGSDFSVDEDETVAVDEPAMEAGQTIVPDAFGDQAFEDVLHEAPAPQPAAVRQESGDLFSLSAEEAPEEEAVTEETPAVFAPAPALAPAPAAGPAPGTAEYMLMSMQSAMAQGNFADAKAIALQLAMNVARMEAERVQAGVAAAQQELESTLAAIDSRSASVQVAEERLREREEAIQAQEQSLEACRNHGNGMRNELAKIEGQIAALDEQIAALMAKREREQSQRNEVEAQLEGLLQEESRVQSELEACRESEAEARMLLEEGRRDVSALEAQRATQEEIIEAARHDLQHKESGVSEIGRTLRDVSGMTADEGATEEE
ncbi:MAG: hypothetical protein HYV27_13640 [Candidatus Hydrogenedentes bacterium]|nr:hypothetical protein [Candidatus Hydrogenedentota bacterium]